MVNSARRLADTLLDALLPQYCVLCGLPSGRPLPLCAPCRSELPANRHCCRRCALPLPPPRSAVLCGSCLQAAPAFSLVQAPWLYGEYMAHLIGRWKFHRDAYLTPLLADLWLSGSAAPPPVDLVVPIPLHWWREWRRGYNQAEMLASAVLKRRPELARRGLDRRLLRRSRATVPQSGMDARARTRNLRGAFTVHGACDSLRVALVDDVLTTGATATAAARELLAAGAISVDLWCLARTPAPEH